MNTKPVKPYQLNEIVYTSFAFGIEKFVVEAIDGDGVAILKAGYDIRISSNDPHRKFYRTGIIKKWYQFWK